MLSAPRAIATWSDEESRLLHRSFRHSGPWYLPLDDEGGPQRRALYGRPGSCRRNMSSPYPSESFPEKDLLDWVPKPDRYLLAVCHYGQLNNQIKCMMKFFTAAAVLNRTLVIPPHSFSGGSRYAWPWELALDIPAAQRCLGRDAVITLDELRGRLGAPPGGVVAVDAVVCFENKLCDPRRQWSVRDLNLTLPPEPPRNLLNRWFSPGELRAAVAFADGMRVLALEDLYGHTMFVPHKGQDPLRSLCGGGSYFRSHPALRDAAEGFANAVLGGDDFVAIHFRRGDFYDLKDHMWPDIPRLVRMLVKVAAARNVTRVFVATNAHLLEVELLAKLLYVVSHARLRLVALPRVGDLPPAIRGQPWAEAWLAMGLDSSPFALAILEKLVCSHAALFIGSGGSTFSDDAFRIRQVEGRAICLDGNIQDLE